MFYGSCIYHDPTLPLLSTEGILEQVYALMTPTAPTKTPDQKIKIWINRLNKLTDCGIAVAKEIAEAKIKFAEDKAVQCVMNDNNTKRSNQAVERYNAIIADGSKALDHITDTDHAQAILGAHQRHTKTDYDDRLVEARELASYGEIERDEVRDYARTSMSHV